MNDIIISLYGISLTRVQGMSWFNTYWAVSLPWETKNRPFATYEQANNFVVQTRNEISLQSCLA